MTIEIRQMQSDELDDVMALHLEGLGRELDLLNQILPSKSVDLTGRPTLKKAIIHMLNVNEGNIFIAKLDHKYIGYCLVTKKFYPVENPKLCGCINGIYIKDDQRRSGTGTALFNLAVAWLKKNNVTFLELYHMVNDERAANFWKKMGFTLVQHNCARLI